MTAVEWLIKELKLEGYDYTIQQAKEIEKQQIIDANYDGQRLHSKSCTKQMLQDNAESYFAETYGSKGSDELSKVAKNTSFDTSSKTEMIKKAEWLLDELNKNK